MIQLDRRITLALIVAIVAQSAGVLLWAGRAAQRLDEAEQRIEDMQDVSDRLTRLEEQVVQARRALDRIETALDRRDRP
ncbi:MAG: hypothetical protein NW203_01955 [Hyphomonadaceae bacterium]|nr:hypothetical protein [Hyphomonadaceae bacterium]